jgi:hypothetical protein
LRGSVRACLNISIFSVLGRTCPLTLVRVRTSIRACAHARCVVDWAKAHASEVRVEPVATRDNDMQERVSPGVDGGAAAGR